MAEPGVPLEMVPQAGHTGRVISVTMSGDGHFAITTGQDGTARLWDLQSGLLVRPLTGHRSAATAAAVGANGIWALIGGGALLTSAASGDVGNNRLLLFDLGNASVVREFNGHTSLVTGLALSADGKRAVSCALDGAMLEWDVTKDSPPRALIKPGGGSVGCACRFGRDAKVALRLTDSGPAELWDIPTGKLSRRFGNEVASSGALARDSGVAVTCDRYGCTVWDPGKGDPRGALEDETVRDQIRTVDISPDGSRVVTGGELGLTVWDANRSTVLARAKNVSAGDNLRAAMAPDGESIVYGDDTGTVGVWQFGRGAPPTALAPSRAYVEHVAFSPRGQLAVSGTAKGTTVWEPSILAPELALDGDVLGFLDKLDLAIVRRFEVTSANGRVTSTATRILGVDARTGAAQRTYALGGSSDSQHVVLATEGGFVVTDTDVWNAATGQRAATVTQAAGFHTVAVSRDGATIVQANDDGDIRWVDGATGAERRRQRGHSHAITTAAFAPTGRLLATGSHDGEVKLWSPDGGEVRRLQAHPTRVDALAFSPDARLLATGTAPQFGDSVDRGIHLWDVATGARARSFAGHVRGVTALAFASDGRTLASGSLDGTTRLWRLDTGTSVVLASADGEWLVYGADGAFDASRRGWALAAATSGLRSFRLDQLATTHNRPDLLLTRMGLGTPELTRHFSLRSARRAEKLNVPHRGEVPPLRTAGPTARVISAEQDGRFVELDAEALSSGAALSRYAIFVNGVPSTPGRDRALSGARGRIHERVELSPGKNVIELAVFDTEGRESLRDVRLFELSGEDKGNLYVVAFGVSKYRDPRLNLDYAHKDAQDVAATLGGMRGGAFRDVHSFVFTNEEVTPAAIRRAKDLVAEASVNDTVVLFVAGHGIHERTTRAEYFFATHDVDVRRLAETAAPFSLLEDLLLANGARRKLFLLDTCESGEWEDAPFKLSSAAARQRGMRPRNLVLADAPPSPAGTRPVAPADASVSRSVTLRDRYIYADLARRTGAIVLSSSRANESSLESAAWQNGAFTAELRAALTTSAADADHDGSISTAELHAYVALAVERRTGGLQHPTVDRDNLQARFSFPIVR